MNGQYCILVLLSASEGKNLLRCCFYLGSVSTLGTYRCCCCAGDDASHYRINSPTPFSRRAVLDHIHISGGTHARLRARTTNFIHTYSTVPICTYTYSGLPIWSTSLLDDHQLRKLRLRAMNDDHRHGGGGWGLLGSFRKRGIRIGVCFFSSFFLPLCTKSPPW
ncbi:hypothetical protein F4809DRAFT_619015 [Biscogniauxia mediterranea]|nr:hypothetical protein F4809DRAFT_619015 [Biscogniauxia mediterranea]